MSINDEKLAEACDRAILNSHPAIGQFARDIRAAIDPDVAASEAELDWADTWWVSDEDPKMVMTCKRFGGIYWECDTFAAGSFYGGVSLSKESILRGWLPIPPRPDAPAGKRLTGEVRAWKKGEHWISCSGKLCGPSFNGCIAISWRRWIVEDAPAETPSKVKDRAGEWYIDYGLGSIYQITETRADGRHWGPSSKGGGFTCLLDEDDIAQPGVLRIPPRPNERVGYVLTGEVRVPRGGERAINIFGKDQIFMDDDPCFKCGVEGYGDKWEPGKTVTVPAKLLAAYERLERVCNTNAALLGVGLELQDISAARKADKQ